MKHDTDITGTMSEADVAQMRAETPPFDHNHQGDHNLDAEAIAQLHATGGEYLKPREWTGLTDRENSREDIASMLETMDELRALEAKLRRPSDAKLPKKDQPRRAAYRVRWALIKQASLLDLTATARRVLPWVLDAINRDGFVGWRSWDDYAARLGVTKGSISKAKSQLVQYDLIQQTEPHRKRLVWSGEQGVLATGSRGPSYTFGRGGFETFSDLVDDVEVSTTETSNDNLDGTDANRSFHHGNLNVPEVSATETSNDLKFPYRAEQGEPVSSNPVSLLTGELSCPKTPEPKPKNFSSSKKKRDRTVAEKAKPAPASNARTVEALQPEQIIPSDVQLQTLPLTPSRPSAEQLPVVAATAQGELIGGEDQIALPDKAGALRVLHSQFDIPEPTDAQLRKVRDTMTKAALLWGDMDVDPKTRRRHGKYKSLESWFRGEWVPRLRDDLEKLPTKADAAKAGRKKDSHPFGMFGKAHISYSEIYALADDEGVAKFYSVDKVEGLARRASDEGGLWSNFRDDLRAEASCLAARKEILAEHAVSARNAIPELTDDRIIVLAMWHGDLKKKVHAERLTYKTLGEMLLAWRDGGRERMRNLLPDFANPQVWDVILPFENWLTRNAATITVEEFIALLEYERDVDAFTSKALESEWSNRLYDDVHELLHSVAPPDKQREYSEGPFSFLPNAPCPKKLQRHTAR